MKRNATLRIVIWSLVILALTAVLVFFLGIRIGFLPDISISSGSIGVVEAHPTQPDDIIHYNKTQTDPITVTVLEELNLRTTPSPQAETRTMLTPGTVLEVLRRENIGGELWGYVEEPDTGWIQMQYVETAEPLPEAENHPQVPASPAPAIPDGAASVPANEIRDIGIDWAAGSITAIPTDGDQIYFYEEGGRSDRPMVWHQQGGKLSIDFCDEQFFGIGIRADIKKDLTILIPRDISLEELEIDAASAKIHVKALTVQEVNLDTASGTADFLNCTVDSMDVDTASGNISFTGSLNTAECDAASADFEAVLTNVPRTIEMDSASGSLKLTLPENAGFSVSVEGLSSKLVSDFETTFQNDRFVHGDGACRIDMDAMSGKVTIKKAQ